MKRMSGLAVALALLLLRCSDPAEEHGPVAGYASSSGTIALSLDEARIYVADADHRALFVLGTGDGAERARIDLGTEPGELLRGKDGTIYVSLRGAKGVAMLRDGEDRIAARGRVGAEPVGLALSPDGSRLYVANMLSRSVSVLDARTLERLRDDIPVGAAPRALAVLPDGTFYVGDFQTGSVHVVALHKSAVPREIGLESLPTTCNHERRRPTQVAALALSPAGDRIYALHAQSRLEIRQDTLLAGAVAPGIATIVPSNRDPPLSDGYVMTTLLTTSCDPPPHGDAPSAAVVDPTGVWIFFADHNADAVVMVDTTRSEDPSFLVPDLGLADVLPVGAHPTGLALTRDGFLLVHAAFDYTVAVVRPGVEWPYLSVSARYPYASSPLAPEVERGRRLFYSAADERVSFGELGGVSCSSCHPEGRSDGLTWRFFGEDPLAPPRERNTPALWGVTATAPYHWEGLVESLPAFNARMVATMGGRGLSAQDARDLEAYLATIRPPDLPEPPPTAEEGRALFHGAAGCAGCHSGPELTDRQLHPLYVHYFEEELAVDTPSLAGVRATAPYLHDGSAPSLGEVLTGRAMLEEHRVPLSPEETQDLVAYLESL